MGCTACTSQGVLIVWLISMQQIIILGFWSLEVMLCLCLIAKGPV